VSKSGEARLLIAEKSNGTYSYRWRIEMFIEDSKQDLGLED